MALHSSVVQNSPCLNESKPDRFQGHEANQLGSRFQHGQSAARRVKHKFSRRQLENNEHEQRAVASLQRQIVLQVISGLFISLIVNSFYPQCHRNGEGLQATPFGEWPIRL